MIRDGLKAKDGELEIGPVKKNRRDVLSFEFGVSSYFSLTGALAEDICPPANAGGSDLTGALERLMSALLCGFDVNKFSSFEGG